jgi:AraC-like DNA-binding protein
MPRHAGDLEDAIRPIAALADDHPGPHRFAPNRHFRAQPIYASTGAVTERLAAGPADGHPLAAGAKVGGGSERTLARLFLSETGLAFGAWRQRLRLLAAIARLAEGQAVTTVAYDLGYDSPSAFIAMFRHRLGTTPGHYLKPAGQGARQGIPKTGPAG